jgi:hypothetical protein
MPLTFAWALFTHTTQCQLRGLGLQQCRQGLAQIILCLCKTCADAASAAAMGGQRQERRVWCGI